MELKWSSLVSKQLQHVPRIYICQDYTLVYVNIVKIWYVRVKFTSPHRQDISLQLKVSWNAAVWCLNIVFLSFSFYQLYLFFGCHTYILRSNFRSKKARLKTSIPRSSHFIDSSQVDPLSGIAFHFCTGDFFLFFLALFNFPGFHFLCVTASENCSFVYRFIC